MILFTCTGCRRYAYLKDDYLQSLALRTGISDGDYLNDLLEFGVIDDFNDIKERMDLEYLEYTARNLLKDDYYRLVINDKRIDKEKGDKYIEDICLILNSKTFREEYEEDVKDYIEVDELVGSYDEGTLIKCGDDYYVYQNGAFEIADLDDIYDSFHLSTSKPLDLTEAIVTSELEPLETSYINRNYQLLANKSDSFEYQGFKVSWNLNSSGIDVDIEKEMGNILFYADLTISNLTPNINVDYDGGKIDNAYFRMDYQSGERIGTSISYEKDKNLIDDQMTAQEVLNRITSAFKPKNDEIAIEIPICRISVPLNNIPGMSFDIDLSLNASLLGKSEIVLRNRHALGFEYDNHHIRFINENDHDLDFMLMGNVKTGLGVDFGVSAAKKPLFDISGDGGIEGLVSTTIHLYDEKGKKNSRNSAYSYSSLDELSNTNPNIDICGDLSLKYYLDLNINKPRTVLGKMGYSKNYKLLEIEAELLNGYTHLENGSFVKECTRKDKNRFSIKFKDHHDDKIILKDLSLTMDIGEYKEIKVKKLPNGYKEKDLVVNSEDGNIASVKNGLIYGKSQGATRIVVKSKDGKYKAYMAVVVGE